MSKNRCDRLAFVSGCMGFILALGLGTQHQVGTFGVETDFYGAYEVQARNLLEGIAYTDQHNPPGYSILLAAVTIILGDAFTAAKFISAIAVSGFAGCTYQLIKVLYSPQIALGTTLLLLIALIPYSFIAATDTVGALTIALPLLILLNS